MPHPILKAAFFAPCLLASACASASMDSDEELVDVAEQAVITSNRLTMNRLTMNRLTMNGLSTGKLSPDGIHVAQSTLMQDEGGRELMAYIVRCALPEGMSLKATVDSTTHTFPGLIGLAPEWLREPIKQKAQRWLSACLLAHVNGYGVAVPLSVRGKNAALSATTTERTAYMYQEVSFYGNVFLPTDKLDELGDIGLRMYACGGTGLVNKCGVGTSAFGPTRTCGDDENCPVEFIGPCQDQSSQYACETADADWYAKCHSEKSFAAGKWSKGTAYAEVVTVYLQPAEFALMYPACTLP